MAVLTIIATGLAIVSFTTILSPAWFVSLAVGFWVLLVISYVVISNKIDKSIDAFIYQGNNLIARIPEKCDRLEDTDKISLDIDKWATNVRKLLRPLGYEGRFTSNSGIEENFGDETKAIEWSLTVMRKSLKQRIIRLQEIHKELRG